MGVDKTYHDISNIADSGNSSTKFDIHIYNHLAFIKMYALHYYNTSNSLNDITNKTELFIVLKVFLIKITKPR